MSSTTHRQCVLPVARDGGSEWFVVQGALRAQLGRSGGLLRKHCEACHRGVIDPACNACRELKAKMETK